MMAFLGLLEGPNREVAAHGRKVVKELIKRVPSLEIVEERLERHAGANEHRLATKDVWIAVHRRLLRTHRSPKRRVVTRG